MRYIVAASFTREVVLRNRILFLLAALAAEPLIPLELAAQVSAPTQPAQPYTPKQARRQFVTVSYDWLYIWPLHLDNFPVEDLVGSEVDSADSPYDYQTPDGRTLVDVFEFKRRGHAVGMTVYPFGMSVGPTLGIRGSIENLPDIRIRFDGPGRPFDSYAFTGGIAYDIGAGVYVADRAPGWGLGSYAFLIGGFGKVTSDTMGGRRYFAEGGGGLQTGPIGVELSLKFGWNKLSEPIEHRFLSVPLSIRATVGF